MVKKNAVWFYPDSVFICRRFLCHMDALPQLTHPAVPDSRTQLCPRGSGQRSFLWCFPCTPRATAIRQARVSGGNYKTARPQPPAAALWLQESTVPLNFSAASAAAQRRRPGSSRWGWRPKCRPRPRRLRADRPAPRACPGRSPSAPPTCPAAE